MKEIATIHSVQRKNTSAMGNPSYYVDFTTSEGSYYRGYTATDAQCGYCATNFRGDRMCEITYHITRTGSVIIDSMNEPRK